MSVESDLSPEVLQLGHASKFHIASVSSQAVPYVCFTIDVLIITVCSLAAVSYHLVAGNPVTDLPQQFAVGLLASLFYCVRMSKGGFYNLPWTVPEVEIRAIMVGWFVTGLTLALIAFLLKVGDTFSRGSFVAFYIATPIALLGMRKLCKFVILDGVASGIIGRRDVVLLGTPEEMRALSRKDLLSLCGAPDVNRFALSPDGKSETHASADAVVLDLVTNFVRRHDCRQILLAMPWADSSRIEFIKNQIKALPISARLLPDARVRSLTNLPSSSRTSALSIELQSMPLTGAQRLIKRAMDIFISLSALVFFLPLLVMTAIAIKMDSRGPMIFRQARKGFNGREFVIFKFRTMTVQENSDVVVQATRSDARITSLGRLLRSSSLDELPQLINVLKGDMSIIGPRPHALAHDNYFESVLSEYAFRHHVKPGITGWAQCNGARGATTVH